VWLATTRDGTRWGETPVWNPFDMTQAPNARGLFLGDYMGLASSGPRFLPLVVLSGADTGNRTDVHFMPVAPAAGTPAGAAGAALVFDDAAFLARRTAFTREAMERRVPGWSRWAGLPGAAR
jgi:hypothetical protein